MPFWLLPLISWVASAYFGIGFIFYVGLPPKDGLLLDHKYCVLLCLLFLFLPFFTKIKLGKILELEREVEKAREELRDFKTDVRNNLSLLSTNINTTGNVSNQITYNLPSPNEFRKASEAIEEHAPPQVTVAPQQSVEEQVLALQDPTLALAWTRIEMERLLRQILGKRTSVSSARTEEIRFVSLSRLFDLFISQYPGYQYLSDAFKYVTQVCNVAIHAQRVSGDQAAEALTLGGQVIAVLRNILGEGPGLDQEPGGSIEPL